MALRDVKTQVLRPRQLVFRVDGTGTASIEEGQFAATLTDNGTGDYTITFVNPFTRIIAAVATALEGANLSAEVDTLSTTAVRVKFTNNSDAAVDTKFSLFVFGSDSSDEI